MKNEINSLIMESMKSGNKTKTEALRAVKTAFLNWETAKENVGKTLDDATEVSIIKKLVAQYEDTAVQCNDGKHDELVKTATDTANVLKEYLPAPVNEDAIYECFGEMVSQGTEPVKKNMGFFIKEIKRLLPGADGKMISKIVSENIK